MISNPSCRGRRGALLKRKKKVMEPTAARGAWVRPLPAISQSVSRGVMVNVALKTAKVHSRI